MGNKERLKWTKQRVNKTKSKYIWVQELKWDEMYIDVQLFKSI